MCERIGLVGLILGFVGLALVGCIVISLLVTPTSAIVEGGGTVAFTATDHQGKPVAVTWSVTSGPGTITSDGVYTAPPTVSEVTNATVTATRMGNPSVTGSATVTIKPPINAGLVDPLGDAFGAATYDIASISTSRTSTVLTITITFDTATPPTIPSPGSTVGPGDLAGFITFDTDQAVATGIPSANSFFCPTFPLSAIGVEFFVSLFSRNAAGNYDIYETTAFTDVGDATPTLAGNVLTLAIPLTDLGGDDGVTDANSVQGDDVAPTDCIPDEGAAVATGASPEAQSSSDGNPYLDFLDALGLDWQTPSFELQTQSFVVGRPVPLAEH